MKVKVISDITKIVKVREDTVKVKIHDLSNVLIASLETPASLLAKLLTVDGPVSTLDADTLDGQEGSFYQNANNLNAGTVALARIPATLTGKDADTLDGQHGSYYRDANNLNAGTVAPARMDYDPAIEYNLNEFTTYLGIPYRSLQNSNTNKQPDLNTDWWEVVGGGGTGQINFAANSLRSANLTGANITAPGTLTWSTSVPIYGGGALFADNLVSGRNIDINLNSVDPAYGGQAWKIDLAYHIENNSTAFVDGEITILLLDGSTEIAGGNLPIVVGQVSRTSVYVFPTTTLTNLKVRIKAAGTSKQCDLRIADLSVSPWNGVSVPAVGEYPTYTPTVGGATSLSSVSIKCHRMGKMLWVSGRFAINTPTASYMTISLPPGLTLDIGSLTRYQLGRWDRVEPAGANTLRSGILAAVSGGTELYLQQDDYSPAIAVATPISANTLFSSGETCDFWFLVPISQWSSSVQVSGEDVEYAYNSDTSNADSETIASAGYGTEGVLFGSYTAARRKRVYFRSPLKDSDDFVIQIKMSGTNVWTDLVGNEPQTGLSEARYQNGVAYGMGFIRNSGYEGSNYLTVWFGTYAYANGAYGAAGAAWSGYTAHRWRVVKRSGGSNAAVPPVVRARYGFGAISVPNSTSTKPTSLVKKNVDSHNIYNSSLNRFIIPISGLYQIQFKVLWNRNFAANDVQATISVNGTSIDSSDDTVTSTGGATFYHGKTLTMIDLKQNDYVEFFLYQNSGGTVVCYSDSGEYIYNRIEITRIGS